MITDVTKDSTKAGAAIAKLVCLLGILFLNHGTFAQQKQLDSIRAVLRQSPPNDNAYDTIRVSALFEILYYATQPECFAYNREIISLSEKKLKKLGAASPLSKRYLFYLADAYYNEGVFYTDRTELDSGLLFYRKSMEINRMLKNYHVLAYTEVEIAKTLTKQGNYPEALELLYKALIQFEKIDDKEGVGDVYKAIGRIYSKQRNYDKALNTLFKACDLYEKIDQKREIINTLFNISVNYSSMKNYKESVRYAKKSIALLEQMGEVAQEREQGMLYSSLGLMYSKNMQLDSAILCFEKSIEIAMKSNNLAVLGNRYISIGDAYRFKKQYPKALDYAMKAVTTARNNHDLETEENGVNLLSIIYELTGNYKGALDMKKLSGQLKDSLRQEEDKEQIIEKQFKYEYEKKALIAKGAEEKKINDLRLESSLKNTRKNEWIMGLSFAFIILAAGSWFLYNYYRQKNVIHIQKNNLLKQQLLLTQMNPHFIFNSLNAIQNFVMKQDSLQAGIYLSQFAGMIRMILDFSRKDYISLESELEFLNHYLELQQLRTGHAFTYTFEIGEDIEPDGLLVPPMLAQPFIENAIEHGGFRKEKKGELRVSFRKEKELLLCVIDDNGVGLKASAGQKKQAGKQHESLATRITLERMETLYHGHMHACKVVIEDKKDGDPSASGVRVTFVIPCIEA
jgi:tetratricopeptide (TPR) repeat protein